MIDRQDLQTWLIFWLIIVFLLDKVGAFSKIQKAVSLITPSEHAAHFDRIHKMFRRTIIGWIVVDKHRNVILWSPQTVKTFGWTEKEAIGSKLEDLIVPPEYRDDHIRGFQRFIDTGKGSIVDNQFGFNIEAVTKSGRRISIRLVLSDISEDGIIEIGGYVFDRTQEIEKEQAYLTNINNLNCSEEIAGVGYWHWDLIGKAVWVSNNFREVFNIREDEPVTSDTLMEMVYFEDRDKTAAAINKAIDDKKDYQIIYRRPRKDGELSEIICKGVLVIDDYGIVKKIHGIVQRINDD